MVVERDRKAEAKTAGERIKRIRDMTGLSQQKFCNKYGIPLRTLQSWESGEREAPGYVINLLERAVREDTQKTSENVPGEWIKISEENLVYECSVCGRREPHRRPKFCASCGAKMVNAKNGRS